ncbi:MAG TPA: sodium-dependent transporter [Methanocorpusculum sp.]|nr:sodium-dependent transporter [Methanocorpusculum sp.]
MAESHKFATRIGFVLTASAAAIGLANIWRFPYLAAKYGGGVFVLIYLVFVVTLGFTLMIAECAIGRKTGKSTSEAFLCLCEKHKKTGKISGILPVVISFLILSYYTVITGWVLKYAFAYMSGSSQILAADNGAFFSEYLSTGFEPILWTLVVFAISAVVLLFGVQKGLEKVCIVIVPILIIGMAGLAVYVLTLPGGLEGLAYCLIPDFSKFSFDAVVAALGQVFFSLSIGCGIYITYGMYLAKKENIESSVHSIEIFDTGAALLAMILIVPMVFTFSGGNPESLGSGNRLLFEEIPQALAGLPNSGIIAGTIFFVIVFLAALLSVFSLIEVPVAVLESKYRMSRKKAVAVICSAAALLSIVVNLGYSVWKNFTIFGNSILDALDLFVSNFLLPTAALLCCFFVGWVIDTKIITDEVVSNGQVFHWKKMFVVMIKYIAPLCILVIMVSNIILMFI